MDDYLIQRPMGDIQNRLRTQLFQYLREGLELQRREGVPLEPLTPQYGEELWHDFAHMESFFGSREEFLAYYYMPAMIVLNRHYNLLPA